MIERIFDPIGLVVVAVLAGAGFFIPFLYGKASGRPGWTIRGVEAAILTVLGGLIARAFISLVLAAAHDSRGACLTIGWGFFLVPGLVDTIPYLTSNGPILTSPEALLMFASVVGGICGMMGGIWAIYDWTGLGWISFPLDVTWALAGNTVGGLLHLINFAWGHHDPSPRDNAHRYASGFGLRPGYAFTQGCVMSNLNDPRGGDLYRHEKTHVWQNRAFGPLYTLTYLGWFVVWLIPAAIAGLIVQGPRGIWAGPNDWCYFNNPWEAWAYAVQGVPRTSIVGVEALDQKMIWPPKFVVAWAVPFYLVAIALAVLAVGFAWA